MPDGFGPLRALGERQLQIQFTLSNMYDTQAMGLLGLNAALAAAAVAGDKLLGHLWWLTLLGLLVSSLVGGSALRVRAEEVGLGLTSNVGLAKEASRDEMDQAIVIALSEAVDGNEEKLASKSDRVWVALLFLMATIAGAIIGVLAF
jgi:hypothetical protein